MKSETSERLDRLMARLFALGVVDQSVLSHEAVGHAKEVALVKEKIRDVCRSAIEENERRLREALEEFMKHEKAAAAVCPVLDHAYDLAALALRALMD